MFKAAEKYCKVKTQKVGEDWEWGYQHTVQYRNMLCFCRPQWCTISGSTAGNDAWFWGHQQITSDSTRTVHCHWPHQVLTAGGTCFSQRGPYSQAGTNCHLNSECKKAPSVSFVQTVNDSEYIFLLVCLCFSVYFLYHHKELWSELPQIFRAQIFGTHFVLWGPIRSSTGWGILSLDICSSECNSQLHVCSTK